MNNLFDLKRIDFGFCVEYLHYCEEELSKSRFPLFLNQLTRVINRLIKVDEKVVRKTTDSTFSYPVRVKNSPCHQTDCPDYEFISLQIEGVLLEIGEQMNDTPIDWLELEIQPILEELNSLLNKYEIAIKFLNNDWDQMLRLEMYPIIKDIFPSLNPLILYLSKRDLPQRIIRRFYDKELPIPRNNPYSSSKQHFSSFDTGSKAVPLVFQGYGRSADRSRLKDIYKRNRI